jgi:hypothetical protein
MKKIVLSIVGAAVIGIAAMNVNLALQGKKGTNLTLTGLFSMAQGESGTGSGYSLIGLEELGPCTDCRDGKVYECVQAQVVCQGSGHLTPDDPCGSLKWGGCQPTGASCTYY